MRQRFAVQADALGSAYFGTDAVRPLTAVLVTANTPVVTTWKPIALGNPLAPELVNLT